ncbi:MAG: HAMP domain-containing histidine kinase [Flavobacteriales bacterium]|nr:HAMP domain-containing histidine kinase [Flavobacteriales bacterium]
MNRNTIRIIIVLASVLLIGLVTTQIFWVSKAYKLEQKQLDHDITKALKNVGREILIHNNDSSFLVDPVKKVTENYFQVAINDTLNPFYLESLLKSEFLKQELNIDFEYGIYDCFSDSVIFKKTIMLAVDGSNSETSAPQIKWDRDGHYFGVYFPNRNKAMISQMSFWLLSSLFLLVVIVFFAYTISVILKQKRLSEIKNDFINNMTHEFKTPISTISLSAEVLMKPEILKDKERLLSYAQIIHSENNRLKNQVERVLQIAMLDKEITLDKTKVNVHQLVKNIATSFELTFKERNALVNFDLAATKFEVLADEIHLANILQNLIDNAIKYSYKSEPQITIKTKSKLNSIQISVRDNGIGIAKENIKLVFDKFYRVPTGDVHNVKGFGLGLNYVKTMIEEHNGSVTVDSKLGNGALFTLRLPVI